MSVVWGVVGFALGAAFTVGLLVVAVAFVTRPPWKDPDRYWVQRSLASHLQWVAQLSHGRDRWEDEPAAPVGEGKSASSTPDGV